MNIEQMLAFRKESLVPDVEEANSENESPRNKLLRLLDEIESRVERFRRGALLMEEEKDMLFSSIDSIRTSDLMGDLMDTEKDEILHFTERVASRCSTVEICVRTVRNEMQEESLHQVNTFIDNLVIDLHGDPFIVKERCMTYMAACGSKSDDNVDKIFESAVLGCSLDDQKRIRRRLQGLLSYIDYSNKITDADE